MKRKERIFIHKGKTGKRNGRIAGMVAAFIAAAGIYIALIEIEKNALRIYEREPVYVAAAEIPKGMVITEHNALDFLTVAEMEKKMVPKNALKSLDGIKGLAATYSISQGTSLTTDMFQTYEQITSQMDQPVIVGLKAEDLYQVVGGVLRQGDKIHIYTVSEDGTASLNWKDIYVQQVFDNSGNPVDAAAPAASAPRINIYLDAENVELFYSELERGSLRVVKVCE